MVRQRWWWGGGALLTTVPPSTATTPASVELICSTAETSIIVGAILDMAIRLERIAGAAVLKASAAARKARARTVRIIVSKIYLVGRGSR